MPTPEVDGYDWSNADESTALYLVVEKSTVDDVLAPTCAALGITFVPLVGLSSNIIVEALADRIAEDRRTARIAYIADLDPGGGIMPRHVSRGFEHLAATERLLVPVAVDRLALTWAQVEKYDLPFADTDADDRRPWGHDGRIELDALVAIAPAGTLQSIVREWAKPYRTTGLRDDLAAAEAEPRPTSPPPGMSTPSRSVVGSPGSTASAAVSSPGTPPRSPHSTPTTPTPNGSIDWSNASATNTSTWPPSSTLTLPDRPLPDEIDDDTSDWLYSSERTYMEQLVAYREHDEDDEDDEGDE